ncbi:sugar 3,4-ketoisomerase [Bacillus mobilis]|uniref:sugar 3,4-ketoisomerase n=1 Tax=Bacillus mobilis TaxID=2026190 RepID=UPI0022E039A8|nr:FdtA/QdtA family cupin domain-containing protein [Bacillus mobilis]
MELTVFDFPVIADERGALIALEGNKGIPFEIKRVYYMYDLDTKLRRGYHAHKELKQILIPLKGSCKMLLDDGNHTEIVELNTPSKGVLIDKLIWHEMYDFSEDCVLMILASNYYSEDDYLRNYEEFSEYIGSKIYV